MLIFEFLFTTALCVVGGLSVLIASFAVFRDPSGDGDQKRAVKAINFFTISVLISVVNEILLFGTFERAKVWKAVTVVGFLVLLASMIIVHFESGRGKRQVLIGTTVQCAIYVLGFIELLYDN